MRAPSVSFERSRLRGREAVVFGVATVGVAVWSLYQNFWHLRAPIIGSDELAYQVAGWRAVHHVGQALTVAQGHHGIANPDLFEAPPLGKLAYGAAQLLVGRQTLFVDRVVASTALVLAALVAGWWIARAAGRWVGLLTAGLLALVPLSVQGLTTRFTRFGYLEPLTMACMVVSVAAAWWWMRCENRRAWWWALAMGTAAGAAAACKVTGWLGVVGPVVLALGVTAWRDRHRLLARSGQVLLAVVAAGAVFLATYLPFGQRIQRIRYMVAYQGFHDRVGHEVGYAGRVTLHQPWWTNFWFAEHGLGRGLTIFLLAAAVVAVVLRRDLLVAWCLAALVGPIVFHCLISTVTLPFYWTLWVLPLLALAALGIDAVIGVLRSWRPAAWLTAGAAVLLLAVPAAACVQETKTVADVRPMGAQVLASVRRAHGLKGPILTTGVQLFQLFRYIPADYFLTRSYQPVDTADTVIVGALQCRNRADDRGVRAVVAVNLAAGRLREIHHDRLATIYEVLRPLHPATPADIAAQPPVDRTAGC
ncbi:MAG TPA: hypothetical protein VHA73_11250 [Acidimicrobiales bacterium]|nr:hypothetical protein [Acidimicrobiales bacterium]